MKAAVGTPTGSCSGSGTDGSNMEIASYARAPTAPPVNRGMPSVGWTRRRGTKARIAASGSPPSTVSNGRSGVYVGTVTGRVWMRACAVADLEQPARTDAQERIAAEPLAALDRLEEVGRTAVVEAEERADRASRGRPGAWRAGGSCRRWRRSRLACARLIGSAVLIARPRESETTLSSRDERSCLPRCHPHSAMPHLRDRRPGRWTWRSALPCIAGALRRSLLAGAAACGRRVRSGGSRVHSLPSSLRFPPATGSLCRRSTGTRPVHSPLFVMSREDGRPRRGRQALGRTPARSGLDGLEADAVQDRQVRVAREAGIGRGALAQPEDRAAGGPDHTGVPTRAAQAGRRTSHGNLRFGGEGGIRTHEVFRLSAFQERRHQPLGHLSAVRISATRAAAGQPAGSMTSRPRYGRRTSGTVTEPSGRWYVSRIAATIRASARPEPLSVWTSSGLAPGSGR